MERSSTLVAGRFVVVFLPNAPDSIVPQNLDERGQSSEIAAGWAWQTHNAAQVDPQGKLIAYVKREKGRPPTTVR